MSYLDTQGNIMGSSHYIFVFGTVFYVGRSKFISNLILNLTIVNKYPSTPVRV